MKLILKRSQKSSMMGKAVFILEASASLSPEELEWVKKYKLGSAVLYSKGDLSDYQEAGVTRAILPLPSADRDTVLPMLDQYCRLIV